MRQKRIEAVRSASGEAERTPEPRHGDEAFLAARRCLDIRRGPMARVAALSADAEAKQTQRMMMFGSRASVDGKGHMLDCLADAKANHGRTPKDAGANPPKQPRGRRKSVSSLLLVKAPAEDDEEKEMESAF